MTTLAVMRKLTGSSLDREIRSSFAAFSLRFGSEARSKFRGKVFLQTSKGFLDDIWQSAEPKSANFEDSAFKSVPTLPKNRPSLH